MVKEKKDWPDKRTDHPAEDPKKLPAAFPDRLDTEQNKGAGKKKRGKGARLHGSM